MELFLILCVMGGGLLLREGREKKRRVALVVGTTPHG